MFIENEMKRDPIPKVSNKYVVYENDHLILITIIIEHI